MFRPLTQIGGALGTGRAGHHELARSRVDSGTSRSRAPAHRTGYTWGMNEWEERIERRLGVLGGEPVVRGTRVPVRVLVGGLAGGMTIAQLCASYRVAEEDVRAALHYAARVLGEERTLGTTLPAA